ncbi:MAG: M48 family metallopeptidase, partial [Bacteroidia bacterium]
MRKILLLLCLVWLLPLCLFGQDFDNYKRLKCEGEIPQKFTTSSTDKYLADIKKAKETKEKRKEKKLKEEFYLESNFLIDELLLSGKILYNDPISSYVNKVMDELLKNEPELRKELEVYVIKSSAVNAFATGNGIIVVNMGLLAKLHNEAELAFILAHEVIHYREKHTIDR